MRGQIIFSHGSDSGPQATKISALAMQAEALGWHTSRPDYREDDRHGYVASIPRRLERLVKAIEATAQPPILVGSSMGAFVSGLASRCQPVAGIFLLATPCDMPDYHESKAFDLAVGVPTWLIHGWNDEICPPAGLIAFAQRRQLPLLMVNDDHRLSHSLDLVSANFRMFLSTLG